MRKKKLKLLKTKQGEHQKMILEKSWDGETVEIQDPEITETELSTVKDQMEKLFDMEFGAA
jgi:hypothetical protein